MQTIFHRWLYVFAAVATATVIGLSGCAEATLTQEDPRVVEADESQVLQSDPTFDRDDVDGRIFDRFVVITDTTTSLVEDPEDGGPGSNERLFDRFVIIIDTTTTLIEDPEGGGGSQ